MKVTKKAGKGTQKRETAEKKVQKGKWLRGNPTKTEDDREK